MMPDKWDCYGRIRAMHVNGVSDRKIAAALGVGRRTVRKYRDGAATPDDRAQTPRKAPLREAAEGEIARMLKENASLPRKQRLSARDMWGELVSKHGIAISEPHARRIIREIRDAGGDEFVPLEHEMGDCAQIDWLEDVTAIVGGVRTAVQVFVCALPYSGAVCAFVYPDRTMLSFLHGHVSAFSWMSGVARRCVYDNLRTAVLSGSGKGAVAQKGFERIAQHYAFVPEFCNREAGWEKSNAENGVKITRNEAFTPIPRAEDYRGLQSHVSASLLKYNMGHRIQGRPRKIWDMFMEEQSSLSPLPLSPFEADETWHAKVHHDQTVRHGKVRYSVPHGYVGKNVTLRVSPFEIKVHFRGELLCSHERQGPNGQNQYVLDHYLENLSRKPRAAGQALPIAKGVMPAECRAFLELCPAADKNRQIVDVMLLARDIGADRVLAALGDAVNTGKPTAELVRYYLYGQRAPDDAFAVEHSDLADYDRLINGKGAADGSQ
ncbi:MAG: IS21 family transposase [Deltaproteobacteria bacterium]|jgi:transposase|nr:IS21 family transposase [Deltaproteobacteria bacterium]